MSIPWHLRPPLFPEPCSSVWWERVISRSSTLRQPIVILCKPNCVHSVKRPSGKPFYMKFHGEDRCFLCTTGWRTSWMLNICSGNLYQMQGLLLLTGKWKERNWNGACLILSMAITTYCWLRPSLNQGLIFRMQIPSSSMMRIILDWAIFISFAAG